MRSRALAHYLGNSDAADAFTYALKLPNLLQNLFGEGVLSASFIPVYVRLLAEKREDEARRVAGAVVTLLSLIVSLIVLGGVLAAPLLVDVFAAGYHGEKREACVRLVRILFPSTGILVLSAWCLGVLNSHRRFFLSYVAPVLWNAAIIAALVMQGRVTRDGYPLATAAAWGAVVGSALQLLVQLPMVLYLLRGLHPGLGAASQHVRQVGRSFIPVVLGRGVVQISSWIDTIIASFLATGAMAGLGYAQMLYLLPISLFGMAVSASELPEMARATGDAQAIADDLAPPPAGRSAAAGVLRARLHGRLPGAGRPGGGPGVPHRPFRRRRHPLRLGDPRRVLGGPAGRHPGTPVRLGVLRPAGPTTPFRVAVVRVVLGTSLSVALAFAAVQVLGLERRWGIVGLALASGIAAWVEMLLLRRALGRRLGEHFALPARVWAVLLLSATVASTVGLATEIRARRLPPRPSPRHLGRRRARRLRVDLPAAGHAARQPRCPGADRSVASTIGTLTASGKVHFR